MTNPEESKPYGAFTKEQLERAIQAKLRAADYLQRAYEICALLRTSEEGEKTFLNRRGAAKELCDEMIPIGYLCSYFSQQWRATEVQLVLGNQRYDAIVSAPEGQEDVPSHIEVTGLDYTDSHRIRHALASNGVAEELLSERARLQDVADRLKSAIVEKSKINKSEKPYPPGTLLLIFQKTTRRLPGWMDVVMEVAEDYRAELSSFKRVIVMTEHSVDLDFRP
jgi:hypothetical protein